MHDVNIQRRPEVGALILGLSLIIATLIASRMFYETKTLGNKVAVTGSAEKMVTSDVVKWNGVITQTVAADGLKTGNEVMRQHLTAITTLLKQKGVDEKEITLQPLNVSPTYANNPDGSTNMNSIAGYTLTQSLTIESSKVDLIKDLSTQAPQTFLDQNILFTTQYVEYYYSKLADLKLDLLSAATKNAKERAEKIVQSTGGTLGPIRSADTGVFQVTAVNSTDISDYGSYDTSSIEKKVTAVVHTEFGLNS